MLGTKNLHILLDVREYERLRNLGFSLNTPLAALAREGIALVLKKHKTKEQKDANVT